MKKILLIDDRRGWIGETVAARTYDAGVELLQSFRWDALWLDHDLGPGDLSGYQVMCWLETHQDRMPNEVYVVSSNPAGRKRIEQVLKKFYEFNHSTQFWELKSQSQGCEEPPWGDPT